MNNKATAYIFWTISINLVIALLMLLAIFEFNAREVFEFISLFPLNLGVAIIMLFLSGKVVGDNLWRLKSRNTNYHFVHGVVAIFLILIIGVVGGCMVGFIQNGLPIAGRPYDLADEVYDYFWKPLLIILIFGSIPTLISGIILGIKLSTLK